MKLVARFVVTGIRPAPWSAPDIGNRTSKTGKRYRFARRSDRLTVWQDYVAAVARMEMKDRPVPTGPLFVKLDFTRRLKPGAMVGELWFNGIKWNDAKQEWTKTGEPIPDLSNLFKATEDALQGVLMGNDVQSCVINATRRYDHHDGVRVTVYEIEPGDAYMGRDDVHQV